MLDIFDINYENCSEKLGNLNFSEDTLPKKGVLVRIMSLLKGIVFYGLKSKKQGYIKKNAVLFFTVAENEVLSIQDIASKTDDSHIFGADHFVNGYPMGKIYLYSFLFIPIVWYRLLICKNPYHKKSFPYVFDGFCIAYSSRYVLRKYLREIEPKKIIITNQLSVYHRSLAIIAKELKIETIYIQHASITKNFSDLNIFSKAFLEGEDSLNKIQANGTINTELYLIGMPKFDKYFDKIKSDESIRVVGICTNGLDNFEAYEKLISYLCRVMPDIKIILRPHPSDRRRDDWLKLSIKYNGGFSDVKKVKSFEFFEEINLIISGDSNIHLEAALLNIPSIYFDPMGAKIDWYGFLDKQLVYYAFDEKEVVKHISFLNLLMPATRRKAKFYVNTIGTLYDGKSALLASLILQDKINSSVYKVRTDHQNNRIFDFN